MKSSIWKLTGIVLAAMGLRFPLLPLIQFPGINDPNHYYNLALRLLDGHGFTMDYLWHFYFAPPTLEHPFDFWQPLTGIFAATGMWLFGEGVAQAIIPFIITGSLLPIVSYFAAKELDCSETASLFVAAAAALLPELLINSLRTDTLIPNALFVGLMMLFLVKGLRNGKWWFFVLSGLFAGLAYLTRGDNLLLIPMLIVSLIAYALWGRKTFVDSKSWKWVILVPLTALLVISPWVMRNFQALGQWSSTPDIRILMYFTDFRDHYHYDREFSVDTLLEQQTVQQLINKRIFEGAAAIRMMLDTLDVILPLAIVGGALLILLRWDSQSMLKLIPPVVLLGGMYFSYVVLTPLSNQGGSFKKSWLTLVPLLLPLAGYALDKVIENKKLKIGTAIVAILIMLQSGILFVIEDVRFTNNYVNFLEQIDNTLQTLPDTNGDGNLIIMTQDPFALRYIGYQSVQIPMESREKILEVAQRYNVDYILFPPARPSLDPIYTGDESDNRFIFAADVNQTASLYRFDFDADGGELENDSP